MKYSVISLIACSLLLFTFCKNNPEGQNSQTNGDIHPDSLYMAIQTDFYAGRAVSLKFKPDYDSSFVVLRNIRMAYVKLPEDKKERMMELINEAMAFRLAFDEHRACTDKLELLSIRLKDKRMTIAEAQEEYNILKATMEGAEARMPAGIEQQNAAEEKVHAEYPEIKTRAVQER